MYQIGIVQDFIVSTFSGVLAALIADWILNRNGIHRLHWQAGLAGLVVGIAIACLSIIVAPFFIRTELRPGEVDIIAQSTRRTVFTKQSNGETFIGATYELGGAWLINPTDYKEIHIEFDATSPNRTYFLVIGNDFNNMVPLSASNDNIRYRKQDRVEYFDVPLDQFPHGKDWKFNQIHIVTPYQPVVNKEWLSFSIRKLQLQPN